MKSRAGFFIRITFIAIFFTGMFAGAATTAGVSAADKHKDHCKKRCEENYDRRKYECRRYHGNQRHRCEEDAKHDRDRCKDHCR